MLLATRCDGADDGARTHGLDVGNVAFYLLNYIRVTTMMSVVLSSNEKLTTCIAMWSGRRGSNP
jgi:hypothetical protein